MEYPYKENNFRYIVVINSGYSKGFRSKADALEYAKAMQSQGFAVQVVDIKIKAE